MVAEHIVTKAWHKARAMGMQQVNIPRFTNFFFSLSETQFATKAFVLISVMTGKHLEAQEQFYKRQARRADPTKRYEIMYNAANKDWDPRCSSFVI